MSIRDVCARHFDAHKGDCSGFAKAVAQELGVPLVGDANAIADLLAAPRDGWVRLGGGAAAAAAAANQLVIAGLRGNLQEHPSAHGHVVVVIPGPLARGAYPMAWWGSLGGNPGQDKTINWAWTAADRDKVVYAAHPLSPQPAG